MSIATMGVVGDWGPCALVLGVETICHWIDILLIVIPMGSMLHPCLLRVVVVFTGKYRQVLCVLDAILSRALYVFVVFVDEARLSQVMINLLQVPRQMRLQHTLVFGAVTRF